MTPRGILYQVGGSLKIAYAFGEITEECTDRIVCQHPAVTAVGGGGGGGGEKFGVGAHHEGEGGTTGTCKTLSEVHTIYQYIALTMC